MKEVEIGEFDFNLTLNEIKKEQLKDSKDILDTTALLIILKYKNKEFARCAYLVSHEIPESEDRENV